MPVILNLPSDPPDCVIQGEQRRMAALAMAVMMFPVPPLLAGAQDAIPAGPMMLVEDEETYSPMVGGYPVPPREILRSQDAASMVAANACICTPCGAIVQDVLDSVMLGGFAQASVRWAFSGTTKDSAGAALPNCRVVAYETGRIAVDGGLGVIGPESPVVAETISDGSGSYSVAVALNTAHQLMGYKAGSPDVAGITRNDATPAAVG